MYYTLELSVFGRQLRAIREVLDYTRKIVHEMSGITTETLRRIEKGDVIPQIATLHILSQIYRIDIIHIFNQYKNDNIIFNIHNSVDQIIMRYPYHTESLDEYIISDKDLLSCKYINCSEIQHFNLLLKMLPISNRKSQDDKRYALECFTKSFENHNDKFNISCLTNYSFSYIELRILFVCGVLYAELKDTKQSNIIFTYLLNHLDSISNSNSLSQQLMTKLLCNISYNYHSANEHDKVLLICDEAIKHLNELNSSYLLETILYRKGIAQYLLGSESYKETLKQSRTILELKEFSEQLIDYIAVSMKTYDIEF